MKITVTTLPIPTEGLDSLPGVVLDKRNQGLLDAATAASGGDAAWRARKAAEAHDLLALSQIAPPGRLRVTALDLQTALRALLWLAVPVPLQPDANNVLRLSDHAVLALTYPREIIRRPLPGTAFIQIFEPSGVWLAAVGAIEQPLCLGAQILANTPARELVLGAYAALGMITTQFDEQDPAGILNLEAARWWQANASRAPLTRATFLMSDEPAAA
jgi:hypothetical protein